VEDRFATIDGTLVIRRGSEFDLQTRHPRVLKAALTTTLR
jgi:hypothetical protein